MNNKRLILILAAFVALAFVANIPTAWKNLGDLQQRQMQANSRFYDWRDTYNALSHVNEIWKTTYPASVDDLVDLYHRMGLERHGLRANMDNITQTGVTKVDVRGVDVGLYSYCVGSDNAGSIRLTAANASGLRKGIESLAARKDVELGSMTFAFDKELDAPYVEVTGLCLRVRSEA